MSEKDKMCGCGKPTRYVKTENGVTTHACNKYGRCPSYNELVEKVNKLKKIITGYRWQRSVDGFYGRELKKAEHHAAEAFILAWDDEV